ncbi:MAG: divergent polysaccharide deacetylase family protein [Xanthobacteraceae bacterium]
MTDDDLNAPLGLDLPKKRRFVLPVSASTLVMAALGLSLVVFAGWIIMVDDPLGGEPLAVVPTAVRAPAEAKNQTRAPETVDAKPDAKPAAPGRYDGPALQPSASPAPPAPTTTPSGGKIVTIIDGTSGKRQEVVLSAAADNKAAPSDGRSASAEPKSVPKAEARLLETTRHGSIPRIGEDGARPADTYASAAASAAAKPDVPRIALVVGGLGVGAGSTTEALAKLPAAVTLTFAAYGTDADRWVARARSEGHEILLQVPMEPFDYPDNDPGPQTLLTSLAAEQNLDRLYWLMSRFQGYVGLTNFMGARFTASEPSLAPVLREVAKRGLIYVDDGSSPRSLAGQIAGANSLPFVKADVMLDAVPTPAAMDRALNQLESIARDRGFAVGFATALPATISRLSAWAKTTEGRGLTLVPITTVLAKPG